MAPDLRPKARKEADKAKITSIRAAGPPIQGKTQQINYDLLVRDIDTADLNSLRIVLSPAVDAVHIPLEAWQGLARYAFYMSKQDFAALMYVEQAIQNAYAALGGTYNIDEGLAHMRSLNEIDEVGFCNAGVARCKDCILDFVRKSGISRGDVVLRREMMGVAMRELGKVVWADEEDGWGVQEEKVKEEASMEEERLRVKREEVKEEDGNDGKVIKKEEE